MIEELPLAGNIRKGTAQANTIDWSMPCGLLF